MAQTEKACPRTASTDRRTTWSWRRLFGKDGSNTLPPTPPLQEDTDRPAGIARRLSRKVIPGLPRPGTFKRQQSELRDRLEPTKPNSEERRTVSVDRRRNAPSRTPSATPVAPARLSAPELLETTETIDAGLDHSTWPPQQRKMEGLGVMWRDKSKREKFFVTFAQTPTHWRRVTISLDYRNAPKGSLEEELQHTRFQRDKSARIYEAIRESLPDIQFYDTVTNLKLQTENDRLHVHVVEDISEIISYPPARSISHLNCRRVSEDALIFDSHLSGFVYKVSVDGHVFIKKEIPGPDTIDEFLYEINALHQLSGSRSVIQFGGVVLDIKGEVVKGLLISFAEKGALIDVIYDGEGKIPWKRRERWAKQIVHGLSEIHEAGFVQGDFTLSNIVIDDNDNAKIIDINRRGCPVGWEPPEVAALIQSNQRISMYIGVKSDLFQLGMVLYALAMQQDEPETQRPLSLSSAPSYIPQYYLDLCRRCLEFDPRRRSHAAVLLSMFPEIEENHQSCDVPVPIIIDVHTTHNEYFPNNHVPNHFNSPTPAYDQANRLAGSHHHSAVEMSDELDYFPRRGRSPPPRTHDINPADIPLPVSATGSEDLSRETSSNNEPSESAFGAKGGHFQSTVRAVLDVAETQEEPRDTAAVNNESSIPYPGDLAGVGSVHISDFEPPPAYLDDDLTTETHHDRMILNLLPGA
ncbi:hypothetical protein B7494_g7597 [Chlorociboria aeruginascens]|nr:hypothetical protein B7494_g7597 [Chlorociboria aeruginascens]